MDELQEIKFDTDTLIHIGGFPFTLKAGTPVLGLQSNADDGKHSADHSAKMKPLVFGGASNGGGSSCLGGIGALTDADAAADLAGTRRPDHPTVSA